MNSSLNKLFLLGISSVIVFLAGCSCGKNHQRPAASDSVLVFKHFKLANAVEVFGENIDLFEQLNPGVHVREEILPSNTNIQHQFYATSLEARSDDFDVFLIDVIWTPEFSLAGWLEELSDLLPPQERGQFMDAPLRADTYRKRLYAIPWYVDGGVFYYRKDLLQKYGFAPPVTFDDLVKQAARIQKGEGRRNFYGFLWQGKQYEGLICAANEIISGFGGAMLDEDGQLRLLDPATLRALQWMKDTIHRYKVSPPWTITADEESTRLSFLNGDCLFLRNWPYCWTFFQREDSPVRGKVGVTHLPALPGHSARSTLGGWQMAVNNFSTKKELAKKFVRFMTSPQTQLNFALKAGTKPSRKALYEHPDLRAQQPFIAELYHILTATRPRPMTPFYPQMSQILQIEFSAVLAGIRSPREAMESASRQIGHILQLEQEGL